MRGAIPPLPNTPSWRNAQLRRKHRDKFTFIFYVRTYIHTYIHTVTDLHMYINGVVCFLKLLKLIDQDF
jgi:hypothetical protein